MQTFEVIEHTADTGIAAHGADIREAFANAAAGLFSLITDLDTIAERMVREVEVSSLDQESLLVEWLNELIYISEVEHLLFRRFDIDVLTRTRLKAMCFGEKVDASRHRLKMEVKAATYHLLRVQKDKNGYEVRVIFDI